MTGKITINHTSKYWYISSEDLGDIGLESDEPINVTQCKKSYRKQTGDYGDIEAIPMSRCGLYLSDVDIMSYEIKLDWSNRAWNELKD